MGFASSELSWMEQKLFDTAAARFEPLLPLALTNPIKPCERGLSIVTKPVSRASVYQANWPVSLLYGLSRLAVIGAVGFPFNDLIREPCSNGTDNGKPGVKYGRSKRIRLSHTSSRVYERSIVCFASSRSPRMNISAHAAICGILTGSCDISNGSVKIGCQSALRFCSKVYHTIASQP